MSYEISFLASAVLPTESSSFHAALAPLTGVGELHRLGADAGGRRDAWRLPCHRWGFVEVKASLILITEGCTANLNSDKHDHCEPGGSESEKNCHIVFSMFIRFHQRK